jgi:aerobic-type carbon monoxide dehydrogenase small subunit (CoxS/CutS family)
MATFNLKINGTTKTVDVDPTTPLLWVLRDHLDMVGTKVWMWYSGLWSMYDTPEMIRR